MAQEYKDKQVAKNEQDVVEGTVVPTESTEVNISDMDIDAILDEIDEVLEENAEEFIRSYVQKGGE